MYILFATKLKCITFIDPRHDPTLQATYTYTLTCIHVCGCVNLLHDLHPQSLDQSICHPSHLKKAHSSNATVRETQINGKEHAPIHMQRTLSPSLLTTMHACIHTGVRNKTIYTHVSVHTAHMMVDSTSSTTNVSTSNMQICIVAN